MVCNMTEEQKEQKIAYYLYNKGAKSSSSYHVQTEEVARETGIDIREVSAMLGNSKYFNFSSGVVVGLFLTRDGLDFVENRPRRIVSEVLVWGTFVAAIISVAGWFVDYFYS